MGLSSMNLLKPLKIAAIIVSLGSKFHKLILCEKVHYFVCPKSAHKLLVMGEGLETLACSEAISSSCW